MRCEYCNSNNCQAINPGMKPEGNGDILIVLDEVGSEADCAKSFYAGKTGKLLGDILVKAGLKPEDCTVFSAVPCMGTYYSDDRGFYRDRFSAYLRSRSGFKCIITLGDDALTLLTNKSGVKSKRGQSFQIHKDFGIEGNVWVSYSIELIRRIPTYLGVVVSDIVKALGSSRDSERLKWEYWSG